jgi:hypothetical protein
VIKFAGFEGQTGGVLPFCGFDARIRIKHSVFQNKAIYLLDTTMEIGLLRANAGQGHFFFADFP